MATIKKSPFYGFGIGCASYVATFFYETTFHGFRHIVMPRRHWFEVLLWSAIVISSSMGAIWIMHRNYTRYKENPIVTSVYKDFKSWNISLPGTTFCFDNKFDADKGKALVKAKWGVEEGDEKFEYYMDFLRIVSNNSTYTELDAFATFQDDQMLSKENLTILMDEVAYDEGIIEPTLHVGHRGYYKRTMLEMGICFSYNSLITQDLTPKIEETPAESGETFVPIYCFYFHAVCYGVAEHMKRNLRFYIHSSYEIPEITSKFFSIQKNDHLLALFKHLDILSSSRIRSLRPHQRHCYFYDEPQYDNLKYYSFNLCRIQCRRDLAMQFCKCVPHFYKTQGKHMQPYARKDMQSLVEGQNTEWLMTNSKDILLILAGQPQCTIKQLGCIYKHSSLLINLEETKSNKTSKLCGICYQACEEVNYYLESLKFEPSKSNTIHITKYHWGIDRYSKTRIKREILFGVEDLLTSLGGTAGFFLGSSIMSGIELIYFFTLRLIRYIFKKSTSKNIKERTIKLQVVESFPPPPPTHLSHYWKTARQYSFQIARQRRIQTLQPYY